MANILSVILGGGKGTRLYPLTADRAKPAVPFGGKYRLVDIPISNSINSGLRRIYVLTQFNTASLHLHIGRTYNFDPFSQDFCEILAAEQTERHAGWYMGTADAVRKNLPHFHVQEPTHYVILSGDQLYRMDLAAYLKEHIESGAEVTIATTPVSRDEANQLGILRIDEKSRVEAFLEKPGPEKEIEEYRIPDSRLSESDKRSGKAYLASMGIYIFNAAVMEKSLDNELEDFGKQVLPDEVLGKLDVSAHVYRGYWEDIGTIRSFYESNLDLASPMPKFNLYDMTSPLYTHRRDLPPSKINASTLRDTLASEGSIIADAFINRSLVGIRTIIASGATLDGVYTMGSDFYEDERQRAENRERGIPDYGIGEGTMIREAIIDKNARIGRGCRIGVDQKDRKDADGDGWCIRDGIVNILKNAVIPDGTSI